MREKIKMKILVSVSILLKNTSNQNIKKNSMLKNYVLHVQNDHLLILLEEESTTFHLYSSEKLLLLNKFKSVTYLMKSLGRGMSLHMEHSWKIFLVPES